ncbi:MAG: AGE family epimerase/isomerase [Bacteroides sp.]|nr:AGE family epimerase/isomerase [Bacteroides sp.]MDD3036849.1 AGE family epimerase/isomerase [Bacteroides sp.]
MASTLKEELRKELTENILPYWMEQMTDEDHGGFYGRITGNEVLMPDAEKGAVLNARILWTFSAAYRLLRQEEYLATATKAKRYLIDRFYDCNYGGIYWSLDKDGKPLDTKKQIYAIGFAIYGLSEYHRATGDPEALEYAIRLFHDIEEHSFDKNKNGYYEALTREWEEIADMRLSEKDANERKTMNTHLHILEPYTNLYRVWKDEKLEKQLRNLISLFTHKILNKETSHLQLFFNDDWQSKYPIVSYGHDIEASWLLHEAVLVTGDPSLIVATEPIVYKIAEAAAEGLLPGKGMIYEKHLDTKHTDTDFHWWVQAETVVGFFNIYEHWDNEEALHKVSSTWTFIKEQLIDHKHGEWFWSVQANGIINRKDDKAGFWKCPYHNSRMCMEIIERVK